MKRQPKESFYLSILCFLTCLFYGSQVLAETASIAASETERAVSLLDMSMGLLGGLALFLYGMDMLSVALKRIAGERMHVILATLTTNPLMGALTGTLVTAVTQSSSVTTVLIVGFVASNLLTLSQSISIILGAQLGSTITAQIIAFKITKYALLMLAVGFAMQFLAKREKLIEYGNSLIGLGLLFFGMTVMSEAMQPLRHDQHFLDFIIHLDNVWLCVLIGWLFTLIIQSSAATLGILLIMSGQGLITLPIAIAVAFGAHIGTCGTALLASIGRPREAVRAAVAHLLTSILGVVIWLAFIDELAQLTIAISPSADTLAINKQAIEVPRQIANAYTLFNLINMLVFIWFTHYIARFIYWLIPEKADVDETIKPKFLDTLLLETPSLALDAVRRELQRIGTRINSMFDAVMPALLSDDQDGLRAVAQMDNDIDILHGHIVYYLGEISKQHLTDKQTQDLLHLLDATNSLENIGDLIETDLVIVGQKRLSHHISFSPETQIILKQVHQTICELLKNAIESVVEQDIEKAIHVVEMKDRLHELINHAEQNQVERLIGAPHEPAQRILSYTIKTDMLEKFRRIYYFAKRIAKTVDHLDNPT
ncbi:Na/Pi cotransporter family protein [Beggiatoa leptomitoformis]|uniref:Na/Pi cotransporter family protein n=1 Tax=Beggiatoa leptomitoformis TaxID=288004 RepID=A0A2N9YE45_9GAMM|nr:Na/Pi cotransporter family protein [Beggiatoa leptomitoformis]ALG68867.1 Na/Pi cotransporter family protein [Beggiatoa leptomitoformis]AUI68763.1 Na/Pi cotransporter family protein [Beggiatoa leptomitoformis]